MALIRFRVNAPPPYKQTPASRSERENQALRRQLLRERAREAFGGSQPLAQHCALAIRYSRRLGRSDSGNIVGGVLDALQGVTYQDDRQVVEIRYAEEPGEQEWYDVTIREKESHAARATDGDALRDTLDRVNSMSRDELERLSLAVQERLTQVHQDEKRHAFHEALRQAGLVEQFKSAGSRDFRDDSLIVAEGEPVSATIIAERR